MPSITSEILLYCDLNGYAIPFPLSNQKNLVLSQFPKNLTSALTLDVIKNADSCWHLRKNDRTNNIVGGYSLQESVTRRTSVKTKRASTAQRQYYFNQERSNDTLNIGSIHVNCHLCDLPLLPDQNNFPAKKNIFLCVLDIFLTFLYIAQKLFARVH